MIRAIDVARSQLGIHEATGKNDGIPAERYMHGDEFSWCAGFALYCNANSDDPNAVRNTAEHYRARSVSEFIKIAEERGYFVQHEELPRENSFVFFGDTDSDVGVKGHHIGIVDSVDVAAGVFYTIEGNYSNKVARVKHTIGEKQVIGWGDPSLIKEG